MVLTLTLTVAAVVLWAKANVVALVAGFAARHVSPAVLPYVTAVLAWTHEKAQAALAWVHSKL